MLRLSRSLVPLEVCPECEVGYLHLKSMHMVKMYNDTPIRIANAPVWACDCCQYKEADPAATQRIRALVGMSKPITTATLSNRAQTPAAGTRSVSRV